VGVGVAASMADSQIWRLWSFPTSPLYISCRICRGRPLAAKSTPEDGCCTRSMAEGDRAKAPFGVSLPRDSDAYGRRSPSCRHRGGIHPPPRSQVKTLSPLRRAVVAPRCRWLLGDTVLGRGAPAYGERGFRCASAQGEPLPWLQWEFFD
jgi:hypothetical protein